MKTCDNCWSKIPDNATVCPKCGATQPEVPTTGNTGGVSEGSYGGYGVSGDSRMLWRAILTILALEMVFNTIVSIISHNSLVPMSSIFAHGAFVVSLISVFVLDPSNRGRNVSIISCVLSLIGFIEFAFLMHTDSFLESDAVIRVVYLLVCAALIAMPLLIDLQHKYILTGIMGLNALFGLFVEVYHYDGFVFWYGSIVMPILMILYVLLYLSDLSTVGTQSQEY